MQDNFIQDSESVLTRELKPGEKLLWSGQPPSGLLFRRSDITGIPVSLAVCGFALFWERGVLEGAMHMKGEGKWIAIAMLLAGLPFVLTGLYMVVGRFFWDMYSRKHTHYGITDKRVLFAFGGRNTNYVALDRNTLGPVSITESPDGSGTLTFDYPEFQDTRYVRPSTRYQNRAPLHFERIRNVRGAYRILQGD